MEIEIRAMREGEWDAVAELIYESTNAWYEANRGHSIFSGGAEVARIFPEVYEALDPGCCLVAVGGESGELFGSCFYRERETHFSLGIMNASSRAAGMGVARRLLAAIVGKAEAAGKPLRLVSSAMNLDSYSLYTRAGFVPRTLYQDMVFPEEVDVVGRVGSLAAGRDGELGDVGAMGDLEEQLGGIRREKDYRYFLENGGGIWRVSVFEEGGRMRGWLASVKHPGSHLVGPGVAEGEGVMLGLIARELAAHGGSRPVFLVPAAARELVGRLYALGARNCELHVAQVLGEWVEPEGVVMPTFMPETG